MTDTLDPQYVYQDHLSTNQPDTLNYQGTDYTFQFFGPQRGNTGNWLEVTREYGVAKKFGVGGWKRTCRRSRKQRMSTWRKR